MVFYSELLCIFDKCKRHINEESCQKLLLHSNLFGITTSSILIIKQFALQIEYKVGILYVKHLSLKNGQFKTLEDISDVLRSKLNWLCEYKILETVI